MQSCNEPSKALISDQSKSRWERLDDITKILEASSADFDWLTSFVHSYLKQEDAIHANIRAIQSKLVSKPAAFCDDAEIITQSTRLTTLSDEVTAAEKQTKQLEEFVKESQNKWSKKVPKCDVFKCVAEIDDNLKQ